jgi:hypothetical protein
VPDTLQSLLVAEVDFGATNDVVSLFVNPALGGGPPVSPDASETLPHTASFTTVDIVYGAIGGPTTSALFDELRFGNTFTDVTSAAAVPEPSALVLTEITGAGLIARRWRRRVSAEN